MARPTKEQQRRINELKDMIKREICQYFIEDIVKNKNANSPYWFCVAIRFIVEGENNLHTQEAEYFLDRSYCEDVGWLGDVMYYNDGFVFSRMDEKPIGKHNLPLPFILTYSDLLSDGNAYVALDFNQPIKKLVSQIEQIKKMYDGDKNCLLTFRKWHNYDKVSEKIKPKLLEKLEKLSNNKPQWIKYGDLMFIYFCHTQGLPKNYIMEEIDRYWESLCDENGKKLSLGEKITEDTFKNYLELMKELVLKEEYKKIIAYYIKL